jgi:VWFA-related protein
MEGGGLGGGEAAGAELFRRQGSDKRGSDTPGAGGRGKTAPNGGRRAPAQLLGDDGPGQCGEDRRVVVDGEGPGPVDEVSQNGVGTAQMLDSGMHGNGKPRGCIHKYAMVLRMADRLSISILMMVLLLAVPGSGQTPPAGPPEDDTPVIRVDVELVNLFFSAREKKGNYVAGLQAADFDVLEDGKKQEIKFFARESDLPLTLGLLVDVSRSQESLIEIEKRASERFFEQVLRPKDMAFIISFGSDTELLQDYTSSPGLLRRGLDQLRVSGGVGGVYTPSTVPGGGRGTVLYDSVWLAAKEKLRREVGRKAIVLITDGVDMGSRVKMGEAIEEAQRSDAIIYTILFEDPRYTSAFFGGVSGEGAMKRMAEETGGRLFRVDRRNSLEQIYSQIAEEMRTQYVIGFTSSNPNKDGTFRRVEIKPKDRNIRIQARKGYYAGAN